MFDINDLDQFSDLLSDELQPVDDSDLMNESFLDRDDDLFPEIPDSETMPMPETPKGPLGTHNIGGWDCSSGCAGNCAGSCNWICQNSAHNDPI